MTFRRAARQAGRLRPAGVGIIVVGILLLYFGLQSVRGGGHPLATAVGFDLCGRLGSQPAPALADIRAEPQVQIPDFGATRSSTCYWPLAADEQGSLRHVWLVMMSQASLRREGNGNGTAKYVETFLAESRASGDEVTAATGPWRTGSTIHRRGAPVIQLLAEDDGVVLWFSSRGLDRDTLVSLAGVVARRLREAQ